MSLRQYLPFALHIAFIYATFYIVLHVFLGHYGVVPRALLAALLVGTPFIPVDWVIFIFELRDRMLREAARILDQH
jgi:hypothetical protein